MCRLSPSILHPSLHIPVFLRSFSFFLFSIKNFTSPNIIFLNDIDNEEKFWSKIKFGISENMSWMIKHEISYEILKLWFFFSFIWLMSEEIWCKLWDETRSSIEVIECLCLTTEKNDNRRHRTSQLKRKMINDHKKSSPHPGMSTTSTKFIHHTISLTSSISQFLSLVFVLTILTTITLTFNGRLLRASSTTFFFDIFLYSQLKVKWAWEIIKLLFFCISFESQPTNNFLCESWTNVEQTRVNFHLPSNWWINLTD